MAHASAFRAGAACAVAGALGALVGNGLRPLFLGLETEGVLRTLAASGRWEAVHAVILLAVVLVVVGLAAVTYAVPDEPAASLAVLARVPLLLGGATALAATALDGFVKREVAQAWVRAPADQQDAAFRVAEAVDLVWYALFAVWVVLLLGVTPLLIGLAQLRAARWPAWLGAIGLLGGSVATVLGAVLLFDGTDATYVALAATTAVFALWVLASGVTLWRRADA